MTMTSLLRLCLAPLLATALQFTIATDTKAQDCKPNAIRATNGRILACSAEDFQEIDITPPPPSALRLPDGAYDLQKEVVAVRPKSWPVRALVSSVGGIYEFDQRGNLVSENGEPKSDVYVAEYQYQSAPLWLGSSHVYYLVRLDDRENVSPLAAVRDAIILADQRACPSAIFSEGYLQLREISTPFLNGRCAQAVKRKLKNGEFWVYPDDINTKPSPNYYPLHWTIQYFNDPVTPIIDVDGRCLLYCDSANQAKRGVSDRSQNDATPRLAHTGKYREKLDIAPPPRTALRLLRPTPAVDEIRKVKPAAWPVRALFNSRAGMFEFDHEGTVIAQSGRLIPGTHVAEYRHGNRPLWHGRQRVYRLASPGNDDENALFGTNNGIVLAGTHACPTQLIGEVYRLLKGSATLDLNSNCARAIKRKIGTGEFWVYPEDGTSEYPQYWVVQYFDDPVSPMRDASGQCWLYCNAVRSPAPRTTEP